MAPWPLRSRGSSSASQADAGPSTASMPAGPSSSATTTPRPRPSRTSSAPKGGRRAELARPSSPTLSARSGASNATRASEVRLSMGPEVIITRADMRTSLDTYERLLTTAKHYRNAMLALASATSHFASALEDCARQKGASHTAAESAQQASSANTSGSWMGDSQELPGGGGDDAFSERSGSRRDGEDEEYEGGNGRAENGHEEVVAAGEKLMAASGLHHMMANQQQILSDTFYKSFEIPLLENYDNYRAAVSERAALYEKETSQKSKLIRDTEAENMRIGRKKQRDLASFRKALMLLQSQVDDLDRLKAEYYHEVLAGELETWDTVSGKVALIVRSQLDSADRIVTKGSSDSMIESMVQHILDPFNAYGSAKGEDEGHIFSILPPLSLSSPANSSGSPGKQHPVQGLARTKTSGSSAMMGTGTPTRGPAGENGVETPAKTARWAAEQQTRRGAPFANEDDEDGATPRGNRRLGKDQLSWIAERESNASEAGDATQPAPDRDEGPTVRAVADEDQNDRKSLASNDGASGMGIQLPDEGLPRWT